MNLSQHCDELGARLGAAGSSLPERLDTETVFGAAVESKLRAAAAAGHVHHGRQDARKRKEEEERKAESRLGVREAIQLHKNLLGNVWTLFDAGCIIYNFISFQHHIITNH